MASAGVSKLRFMTKARDASGATPESVPGDDSAGKWSLSTFDPSKLYKDPSLEQKLTSINVMARRSYGGANVYIEQHMSAFGKSSRKRKSSQ